MWTAPPTVSEHEIVRGFGGVVPPVLAGFALATTATLVTASSPPPLATWAAVGLVVAASSMIYAMQFLICALRYWSSPAERLAWRPEAEKNEEILREERWFHALDQAIFTKYAHRGRFLYNVGIVAFFASFILLVIPQRVPWFSDTSRWVVVVAAGLGLAGELVLVLGAYVPAWRPLIWPDPREVQAAVAATWDG
jgi:hypothetical protein